MERAIKEAIKKMGGLGKYTAYTNALLEGCHEGVSCKSTKQCA